MAASAAVDGSTADIPVLETEGTDVKTMLGMSVFYVVFGFLLGMILGGLMKLFKMECCEALSDKCQKILKFFVALTLAVTTPIWCHYAHFHESKFILIIFYGYFAYREWGDDGRPDKELAFFWIFCQPFVFATVGAAVQFKYIEGKSFGLSILVIFLGVSMRWIGTIVAASEPKFGCYEKMFFGFAWIPKATVQAAIGGTTLLYANNLGDNIRPEVKEEWVNWGKILLSMAVIAVIITAPLGAILTNTLGPIWLEDDSGSVQSHRSVGSQANYNDGKGVVKYPRIAVEEPGAGIPDEHGQEEATNILHAMNGGIEPKSKVGMDPETTAGRTRMLGDSIKKDTGCDP